ncbi:class GN sortase [Candidatus Marimicrobium litorale]|uniref:Class GN sortase n=1 Tax=Candidatus Marimicrobium litorale TaxID=2518991 RepID=A0ABT3T9T5_9GAMM|nr:class GN sortase [Candidatus Marimicrobium litorale]MCX2979053.1 class GN sortase [Candidatus Marimicrobium litorale]
MRQQRISRRGGNVIMLCLLVLGIQQLSGAAIIKAKAGLAPLLIEKAWEQTLRSGEPANKPWPWADTWPVGRLRVDTLDVDLLVLEGDSGNALAFGPGRALPSAQLGSEGTAVIGGHRDTHFSFLQHMQKGQMLQLQVASGKILDYEVQSLQIVDASRASLSVNVTAEALVLVTCYPFDALQAGGPLRYVVTVTPKADLRMTSQIEPSG